MQMRPDKRAIDKIYKRRDRYEIPDWQRGKVWSKDKKQQLLDSILRGWKLPKFYFVVTSQDPEEFEVVDGQQRLTAIWEFFDNDLPLTNESTLLFGGPYYKDLKQNYSDAFDDFEIEFDRIEDSADDELKQFFQRLQEGLPLTSSEKLNSVQSALRDFCLELSKKPFFTNKINIRDYRHAHFDIIAKVAAIEIDGLKVGHRYDDLKRVFESQIGFSYNSQVAKRLNGALAFLDKAFPDKTLFLRSRTILQSIVTLACRLVATEKADGLENTFYKFVEKFMSDLSHQVELGQKASDEDYINFQKSVAANIRSGSEKRHEILLRKLLSFDSKFADILGSGAIAESGITKQIKSLGDSIISLVAKTNEAYSSKHGIDLFRHTNKTSLALNHFGKTIQSFEEYQRFIDNLYYMFHEGHEGRLNSDKPISFGHIKDLRTDLRHDLGKDSASKRIKVSATFKNYAGGGTPSTVDPERFMFVQLKILEALEKDLQHLMANLF
jgi:hypothetical protein